MRLDRYDELMPAEAELAEDTVHCQLNYAEYELVHKAICRKLIMAATGTSIIREDAAQACVEFLGLPVQLVESVGFPLSDELASVCAESLEEIALFFETEGATQIANGLARSFREEMGI